MKRYLCGILLATGVLCIAVAQAEKAPGASSPLGLPPVPVPADNPQTAEKIALGDKLFHDKRFSSTGEVSCATCHASGEGVHRQPAAASRRASTS